MPDLPSTANIRQCLFDFFNDEELTTLCFDYFPVVHSDFAPDMAKGRKIQLLLEYCQRREIIPNLLAAIQCVRPDQYKERFPEAPKVEARPGRAKPVRDPKQAFVCHAHEDAEFAHRLANDLQQNGWRAWIAPDSIRPGEMWGEGIDRGMDESGVLVLALTPRSVQSPWVRKETYVAIQLESQGRIKFIPLEVEPCDVPGLWSAYQRISFQSDYGSGLNALLDVLEPARRERREREAQEKAAREEAVRQARLAAEKAEAERLAQERREREAQESARRLEAERQAKLGAQKAEAERLERERNEREARLKVISSQPEPVAGAQAAHTPQPTRRTKPHLPAWALRAAVGVLAVVVLIVIAGVVVSALVNNAAIRPSSTAVVLPTSTPFPGMTRIAEKGDMAMVYVPAGDFLMGTDSSSMDDEQPQHKVYLDAFWIDRTEVTNVQYQKCLEAGTCKASSYADDSKFNGDNQPVVGVDWNDAKTYCEWAGRGLPTEAQSEKAARGTDGRLYPWGNQAATCDYAVMDDGSGHACGKGTTWPVGSKPQGASPYGALDMAGNVREWVADWYDNKFYASSTARNPTGPSSGSHRVLRGGSWDCSATLVRAASRFTSTPDIRDGILGFRCVSAGPGE